MDKDEFVHFLCTKRDCVKSTAVVTYYNLKRIRKQAKIPKNGKWLNAEVRKSVESLDPTPRKNLSASVVSYLKALGTNPKLIDPWQKLMKSSSEKVDKRYATQRRTKRQEAQWLQMRDVKKIFKEHSDKAASLGIWAKPAWQWSDSLLAQKVLQLAFHGGTQPPPRLEFASLEYTKTPDETRGNILYQKRKKWMAVIRHGKTTRRTGPQIITFNQRTARILNKFLKHLQPGDFVFRNAQGKKLSPNAYGKRLQNMYKARFGKTTGAGLLRVIYVTEKYKDIPALKEIDDTAKQMLHSSDTALRRYTKKV